MYKCRDVKRNKIVFASQYNHQNVVERNSKYKTVVNILGTLRTAKLQFVAMRLETKSKNKIKTRG